MQIESEQLRFRLRAATADLHRQLEERISFEAGSTDKSRYLAFLQRMFGLHRPIETGLGRLDWTSTGIDISRRRRHMLIEADLRDFGMAEKAIASLPASRRLPLMDTTSRGLGVLYVLEGSALGGKVILAQLGASLGISPLNGGRFLAGYGADSGYMWQSFIRALDDYKAATNEAESITCAAIETFQAFDDWFAGDWASTAPPIGE